jgi:hypothetical protein
MKDNLRLKSDISIRVARGNVKWQPNCCLLPFSQARDPRIFEYVDEMWEHSRAVVNLRYRLWMVCGWLCSALRPLNKPAMSPQKQPDVLGCPMT